MKVNNEIIIEREDRKYKVRIILHNDSIANDGFYYRMDRLWELPKGKRKWRCISESWREDYHYRNTPYDKRDEYIKSKFYEVLTSEEIKYAFDTFYKRLCMVLDPNGEIEKEYRVL